MKKFLNTIIVLLGFGLLIVLALNSVNNALIAAGAAGFIDLAKYGDFIVFLQTYGALIVVAALVFVNLLARSLIRIVFVVLFLLAFALYVWTTAFPATFTGLFGF